VLILGGANEIDGEVPDDGHIFRAVAFAQTGLVFVEDNVKNPVQLVFDGPYKKPLII
jgi:hypothetical protein